MSVLVGDPLYRPYASFSTEEGVSPSASVWSNYRRIVMVHGGNVIEAAGDLRARAEQGGQSLYIEALGNAQMDEGQLADAEASFRRATELAHLPVVRFRLLLETARCLEKEGHADKGAALLRQGLVRFNSSSQRGLLLAWIARLDPIKPAGGKS